MRSIGGEHEKKWLIGRSIINESYCFGCQHIGTIIRRVAPVMDSHTIFNQIVIVIMRLGENVPIIPT
jgi:hypothetical protein